MHAPYELRRPWHVHRLCVCCRWVAEQQYGLPAKDVLEHDLYYPLAVALATHYASLHCYELRVYRFRVARRGKTARACSHPTLGGRGISWCKLVATHHTLWQREAASDSRRGGGSGAPPSTSQRWKFDYVVYLDSDAFFHDTTRSIPNLLHEYSGGPPSDDSQLPFRRAPFAFFATNWPYTPMPAGTPYSIDAPGKAKANAAFFVLRNGQPAKQFVAAWWSHRGAEQFAFRPWYEQVALSLMWPVRGVVVLNSSTSGEWAHMNERSIGSTPTPTSHIESARGRRRLGYMQAALLALTLNDARRGRSASECGAAAGGGFKSGESRVVYLELGVNQSVDLAGPPTIPVLHRSRFGGGDEA